MIVFCEIEITGEEAAIAYFKVPALQQNLLRETEGNYEKFQSV
jgi:hypothetical protein